MLLNFVCSGFPCFREGFHLSMIPEKRLKELNYSIITERITEKEESGLSASVICGSDTVGRTSITNAVVFLRQIVCRGNIRYTADSQGCEYLMDIAFREEAEPIRFDITFTSGGIKYRYALAVCFGEKAENRYIDCEQLYINDSAIFERSKASVDVLKLHRIADWLNTGVSAKDAEKIRMAMSENMTSDSLLLTTDFNFFCSKRLTTEIRRWFSERIMVITDPNSVCSCSEKPENGVPSAFLPVIISALRKGAVLIIGEFDAMIPPSAIMNLITVFHNTEINTNGSQLIIITPNPIYMNHNLLRRDEIRLVETDAGAKSGSLYALSDFRADGRVSVRKTDDYMQNYLAGRYGAMENTDLTDTIANALSK